MKRLLLLLILLVTVAASKSHAVNCHCFQDRTFDPQLPTAADAYFLATTQNSLLSAALNIEKSTIVRAKMGGADADLLWVVYYLSDRTGLDTSEMIELYTNANLRPGFISTLVQSSTRLDKPFIMALTSPDSLERLAAGAYRSVMQTQLGIRDETLAGLELAGASRKEQILSIFISLLLAEEPSIIFKAVRTGKKSWSQSLAETGLEAKQIEAAWKKLIKFHQTGRQDG